MSEIITPILTDRTFSEKLDVTNKMLGLIAGQGILEKGTYDDIAKIVRAGLAPTTFSIGDQINVKWNGLTVPLDIVHFGDAELEDGSTVPGMYLQWHYAIKDAVQFDATEAFYVVPEGSGLTAGTYYFTSTVEWSNIKKVSYQFTTTKDIPAGGQIVIPSPAMDTAFANWRVYTYETADSTEALEGPITPVQGTSGTYLGEWNNATLYGASGMNQLQRSAAGYNRWAQSGLRQYLNSSAAATAWWSAQNPFDRPPSQLSSLAGFLTGFESDFLSVIKPVKVRTYHNTVTDTALSSLYDDTYDYWFPAGLEQEYVVPQAYGEGEYWEYWKNRVGTDAPQAQNVTDANRIRYAINAQTSPQGCRLRSANRGFAYHTRSVHASGSVSGGDYAHTATRCAPACVIC